jgi:hypothetical protein
MYHRDVRGLVTLIALTFCSVGCDALFGLDSLKAPGIDAQYLDARVDAGVLPDATCVSDTVTTTILGARSGGLGQASMADTHIIEKHLSTNYGAAPTIALCNGCDATGTEWNLSHSIGLVYFDTSSLCQNVTVVSAELLLDTTGDNLGAGEVGVFLMLEPWTEGDGPIDGTAGAANWAQAKANTAWKSVGASPPGSRDGAALATFTPDVKNAPYAVALTPSPLERWFTSGMNYGLALVITSGDSDVQFYSRESASVSQRPGLKLTTRVEP